MQTHTRRLKSFELIAIGLRRPLSVGGAALWRPSRVESAQSPTKAIPVTFKDVREAAGITFKHEATMTEEKNYLETMGAGVGWIDSHDQDGLMDLYLVQSAATDWYKPSRPLRSVLYHNNGNGTFTDVTDKAGVGAEGFPLDRDHMQQKRALTVSREPGQFVISISDAVDLTLERLALKEKGNLFEEVFGMKAVVRNAESTKGLVADG